jgi:hypothetical protein
MLFSIVTEKSLEVRVFFLGLYTFPFWSNADVTQVYPSIRIR